MKKLLLYVVMFLLAAAQAPAQEAGADAARLLKSGDARERAWGAYHAGEQGLKEFVPELVRLLDDPALGYGADDRLLRQAALDALIRLDAEVPAEVLRALPRTADEAIILLARSPEANQAALLETFAALDEGAAGGARWLAVGNLLAGAGGFAARLLGRLRVEADVTILDGDVSHGSGGLGSDVGVSGCGGLFSQPPEGFPPVGFYTLTTAAQRGAVVVAPGRRPVFYFRSPSPAAGEHFSPSAEADAARVEYLAALLDTTKEEIGFDPRPSQTIICGDAAQCRRELAGVRGRIRQSYSALVGRLSEKNLLDGAGDVPAAPHMTFTLYDERGRKSFPLPERLSGVNIVVWESETEDPAADASGDATP